MQNQINKTILWLMFFNKHVCRRVMSHFFLPENNKWRSFYFWKNFNDLFLFCSSFVKRPYVWHWCRGPNINGWSGTHRDVPSRLITLDKTYVNYYNTRVYYMTIRFWSNCIDQLNCFYLSINVPKNWWII